MRANLYTPTSTAKTPVSAEAVIKRVNRRTKTLGITLKAMPPGPRREYFGQFYVVGPEGLMAEKHVDLDQMARELGVLTDDEEIRTRQNFSTKLGNVPVQK
ncbi:MAG: hypothetical protein ACXWKP_07510 [Bradyrhizobium sp.]